MTPEEIDKELLKSAQGDVASQESESAQVDTALAEEALQASESAAAEEKTVEQASETPAAEDEQKPEQGQAPEIGGAFAQMKRDHAVEVASLQSQIAVHNMAPQQPAVPVAPVEKSPRQKYLDENPEAEFFPPAVEIAQEQFKSDQTAKTAEVARQETELGAVTASINKAGIEITDATHGSGLQKLISIGSHLLTQNDKTSIWLAGEEAGEQMYSILTRRIRKAGITLPTKVVTKSPAGKTNTTTTPAQTVNQSIEESEEPELDPHVAEMCSELGIRK